MSSRICAAIEAGVGRGSVGGVLHGCGGDGLIHDGERVAHGAVSGLGEQGESAIVGVDAFGRCDAAKLAEDVDELHGVKREVLTARADGLGQVLGLGGGHHEDDVVGRFLERFEESIEGGVGDLVRLVEDVDFVLVARGAVSGGVAEFADLVDAAVGGGVDFDDIDGVAGADLGAGLTDFAGLGGGADIAADGVAAVKRHGEDAGNGGLADAAMAAEDVAVGDAVLGERVHQGHGDVILANDIGEALRTIFAG